MASLALNVDPQGAEAGSRRADTALRRVKTSARSTEASIARIGPASTKSLSQTGVAATAAAGKIKLLAGAAIAAATIFAKRSVGSFLSFDRALSEVSTLIEGTETEIRFLDNSAKELAATFGGTATQQVEAFYQAISAGAGSVEEANKLLQTANTLAVAGVTDITTSVDLLTTTINAYGRGNLTAAKASDILFTGVRAGKTTVDEMNVAMGRLLASTVPVGIGLEETTAALATLTASGIKTAEASTAIVAAISNIAQPSEQASAVAKQLGLDFSATALETLGLAGFLEELRLKTGGSSVALRELFGSVRGFGAIFTLLNNEGKKFNETLGQIEVASGATNLAFAKVSETLSQRFNTQMAILSNFALEVGGALVSVLVPALEAFTGHLEISLGVLTALGIALRFVLPVTGAILAAVSGIAFLRTSLGKTTEVTHSFSAATDILTKSLEDEIKASGLLTMELAEASTISTDVARMKLGEARARYENISAIIAEQLALKNSSAEFVRLTKAIDQQRTVSNTFGFSGTDVATSRLREAFEHSEQALAALLVERQALIEIDGELAASQLEAAENIRLLDAAIGTATAGLAVFNTANAEGAQSTASLSESYNRLLASINPIANALRESTQAQAKLTSEYAINVAIVNDALAAGAITQRDATLTLELLENGYARATNEIRPFGEEIDVLRTRIHPATAAIQTLTSGTGALEIAQALGITTVEDTAKAQGILKRALTNVTSTQDEAYQGALVFIAGMKLIAQQAIATGADLDLLSADAAALRAELDKIGKIDINVIQASVDPIFAATQSRDLIKAQVEAALASGQIDTARALKILEQNTQRFNDAISAGADRLNRGSRRAASDIDKLSESYVRLKSSIDPAYAANATFLKSVELVNAAQAAGIITAAEAASTLDDLADRYQEVTDSQNTGLHATTNFFLSIVTGAKNARDAVIDLANTIAAKLLQRGIFKILSFLFPGGGKVLDFIFNANGNAYRGGEPLKFANGGIVDRPTQFSLSNGRRGILGEAGPEVILPLSRGTGGKLGVTLEGGLKRGSINNISVNYTIDARGTNNEAVENLRREQQRDRARLKTDVVMAIREAQQDRIL